MFQRTQKALSKGAAMRRKINRKMADPTAVPEGLLYMIGSVASGAAFLSWFMADQLSRNRRVFYQIISRHNKEDDDRFEALSTDIWRIHLRNARRDGDGPPERKTFSRRRYLTESVDEAAELDSPSYLTNDKGFTLSGLKE